MVPAIKPLMVKSDNYKRKEDSMLEYESILVRFFQYLLGSWGDGI